MHFAKNNHSAHSPTTVSHSTQSIPAHPTLESELLTASSIDDRFFVHAASVYTIYDQATPRPSRHLRARAVTRGRPAPAAAEHSNAAEVGIRVVEEVSGAVVEYTLSTDLPPATQLLSPRNYLNNGGTAAAVSYDCSGLYVETDF